MCCTLEVMMHRFAARVLLYVAIGIIMPLGVVGPAYAALGGDAASVAADAGDLHGVTHFTALERYDLDEITTDNGTRVREFLNRAGVVFAVTWSGPVVPDLQTLLGARFEGYLSARAAMKPGGTRRSLRFAFDDAVMESGGHMRAYGGRAYLPLSLPAGTSMADIR
jgi:uncharacterized protein DUF2844